MKFKTLNPKAYTLSPGFSTIEILLAMTILVLCLTAVVLVASGSQSLLVDSQTSREALGLAQGLIEKAQADSRKDFKLVTPHYTETTLGSVTYRQELSVTLNSDYLTKTVYAKVSWPGEHGRDLSVELSGLVTNFNNISGTDTCDSAVPGNVADWKHPNIQNGSTALTSLGGVSGSFPVTDIEAHNNKLYVTAGDTPGAGEPTLFVFNISSSDPNSISLAGKADNTPDVAAGLAAVVVHKTFAYVASARSISMLPEFGQFQVFDVSSGTPSLVPNSHRKMPGVTGSGLQGIGNSIAYKDGYIYLGLTKTASGPEFHIIDVHTPSNPIIAGSYSVGNTVNSITLHGKYAYLTTPNSQELIVLDISNPNSPVFSGGFDAAGNSGNGKSLYAVGDELFLGRTSPSTGPELSVLNNANPLQLQSNNPNPQGQVISGSVDAVVWRAGLDRTATPVTRSLLFSLTPTRFQVWDYNPSFIPWTTSGAASEFLVLPQSGSSVYEPVLDCEANYFYAASNNASNEGFIYVIAP